MTRPDDSWFWRYDHRAALAARLLHSVLARLELKEFWALDLTNKVTNRLGLADLEFRIEVIRELELVREMFGVAVRPILDPEGDVWHDLLAIRAGYLGAPPPAPRPAPSSPAAPLAPEQLSLIA
jgi:hypothetical protein